MPELYVTYWDCAQSLEPPVTKEVFNHFVRCAGHPPLAIEKVVNPASGWPMNARPIEDVCRWMRQKSDLFDAAAEARLRALARPPLFANKAA